MILRKLYIYIALIAILAISPLTIFAAGAPDVNTINKGLVIRNAIAASDALYVVHYDIDYTILPTEPMSDLFIGSLVKVDSSGSSVATWSSTPLYADIQPKDGFGEGLWGIYLETDPYTTLAAGESLQLCNDPVISTGPSGNRICTSSITTYDGSDATDIDNFQAMILELAENLEEDWDTTSAPVDIVVDIAGSKRLTDSGDDYISHAITNIRLIIPNLFTSGLGVPRIILDEERDTTYETARGNYFQGTELDLSLIHI